MNIRKSCLDRSACLGISDSASGLMRSAFVVIAIPLSTLTTILLFPLWSWLEASTGIESIGHSGPAEWCYATVFVVVAAAGALVVFIRQVRRRG